ncbi:hypothetical protein [Olivibacter sitiensis]|uniref:hypothetical protein n=1 Tax=Olivibacter sitiensis TaxID=376470 RepID=UPI0012F85CEB|nr:hypothetical protein [Olivibacter sitiensis]
MKSSFFSLTAATLLFVSCQSRTEHILYGKWDLVFESMGADAQFVFRKDGTHDYFVNGKLFSSGRSIFRNDTLKTMDPICNSDYYATYKVNFISADSVQFVAVEDSCPPRKQDMDGVGLKRVR